MSNFDWFMNATEDIIDSYFITSELVDIDISESELTEMTHFDSPASQTADNAGDSDIPLGKLVL